MRQKTCWAPDGSLPDFEAELQGLKDSFPGRVNVDPDRIERDLVRLVLALIELLRGLLERQALRRFEAGSLTPEEIERVGLAFLKLEKKMTALRGHFGLTDADLSLSLGPVEELCE